MDYIYCIYCPWFPVAKKICAIYIVHGSLWHRKILHIFSLPQGTMDYIYNTYFLYHREPWTIYITHIFFATGNHGLYILHIFSLPQGTMDYIYNTYVLCHREPWTIYIAHIFCKEYMCYVYSPWFPVAKKICVIYIVHGSLWQRKYVLYL
jgi:hypothetical protein